MTRTVTKEVLDDAKARQLFGANYGGVVFYDLERGTWNKNVYLGKYIEYQDVDAVCAKKMQKVLSRRPEFEAAEVIGCATMLIEDNLVWPVRGAEIKNATYCPTGTTVAGTLIRRDKQTGKILPIAKSWVAVNCYVTRNFAARNIARSFAAFTMLDRKFQQTLIQTQTNER